MRVMAAASQEVKLVVDGFPDAQTRKDNQGQSLLITEKQQVKTGQPPISKVKVTLKDLPTPGYSAHFATGIAAMGILIGLVLAKNQRGPGKNSQARSIREQLLEELEELELAHRSGEIGPKTYERARRELIDAIARTLQTGVKGKSAYR
jgi:hypothetical protein